MRRDPLVNGCTITLELPAFVFVHSYSSCNPNWHEVMVGDGKKVGRLSKAKAVAAELGLVVRANDKLDHKNKDLLKSEGVLVSETAVCTGDEIKYALDVAQNKSVVFVTSPDHLPRVVRDALLLGGSMSWFLASDIPFSAEGVGGVSVVEPDHKAYQDLKI